MISKLEPKIFELFIGSKTKQKIERYILVLSLVSFGLHLALIYLSKFDIININDPYGLLSNPISAIYTPFSFILIYEIYLLIYYLPRSMTTYISKQYEIITLIVIRRIFKDISNINYDDNLFLNPANKQLFLDLGAAIILFLLIYLFRKNTIKNKVSQYVDRLKTFIKIKKWISALLIPLISTLAIYNFMMWLFMTYGNTIDVNSISSLNTIFFDELFQLLILVDVLLLIFSFFNSDSFHIIMRNSGFIISTILIRISFMTEGISNLILIISSLLFGLLIQFIYKQCEKDSLFKNDNELLQ
ncbi:MAG: hypothetical protein ACON4E_00600 [Flavobacteriales bacterium]